MRGPWRIARIMGIDIYVDLSWFLIVFLLVYSLGFLEFPRELNPRAFFPRADVVSISLGVITSLLLFGSVLAHELSHSWMAIQRGIPVTQITLFIFGGVARIAEEPDRPSTEFLIAVMGPLMSFVLAILFGAAWLWFRVIQTGQWIGTSLLPLILLTGILFQGNGTLALFNLAPGFPLDGGRIFRAILWGWWRDVRKATLWATRAGQALAIAFIAVGSWLLFLRFDFTGIWYALIGFFVWSAARESYRQTLFRESMRGITVDQLMTRSVERVSPDLCLQEFVDTRLIPSREQTFAVYRGDLFEGTISADDVERVSKKLWPTTRVRDAMTPCVHLDPLSPGSTAISALAHFARIDEEEAAVMSGGQFVGFLGRRELSRFIRLRT